MFHFKEVNMDAEKLYTMNLHEDYGTYNGSILRIPGGWIYTQKEFDDNGNVIMLSSVFVPFNKEFQKC